MAELAAQVTYLFFSRGGRTPRLVGRNEGVRRRERKGESPENDSPGVEGRQDERSSGIGIDAARRPRASRDGICFAGACRARGVRRREGLARQRQGDDRWKRQLRQFGSQDF